MRLLIHHIATLNRAAPSRTRAVSGLPGQRFGKDEIDFGRAFDEALIGVPKTEISGFWMPDNVPSPRGPCNMHYTNGGLSNDLNPPRILGFVAPTFGAFSLEGNS